MERQATIFTAYAAAGAAGQSEAVRPIAAGGFAKGNALTHLIGSKTSELLKAWSSRLNDLPPGCDIVNFPLYMDHTSIYLCLLFVNTYSGHCINL